MFKYEIGDTVNGFLITDRMISPVSGKPVYFVNYWDTPFFEDELENMEY